MENEKKKGEERPVFNLSHRLKRTLDHADVVHCAGAERKAKGDSTSVFGP